MEKVRILPNPVYDSGKIDGYNKSLQYIAQIIFKISNPPYHEKNFSSEDKDVLLRLLEELEADKQDMEKTIKEEHEKYRVF